MAFLPLYSPKSRNQKQMFLLLEVSLVSSMASLVLQMVKNLPALQETWVRSLGWEDSLEMGMATQLQYSCLENFMDGETWWTTVHGVAKSRT